MKALVAFLLVCAVFFTSCRKDEIGKDGFGTPCSGCTLAQIPKPSVLLSVHVNLPPDMAGDPAKTVDWADLSLLDATTREVIDRKRVAVKGNGNVVDIEYASTNSALLYSSQVVLEASSNWYFVSFHSPNAINETQEILIDCRYGSATVAFTF